MLSHNVPLVSTSLIMAPRPYSSTLDNSFCIFEELFLVSLDVFF